MVISIFIILFILLNDINGKEEYNDVFMYNDFQLIDQDETLTIHIDKQDYIAYFDSFDKHCLFYLSLEGRDEWKIIDGKFEILKYSTGYQLKTKIYLDDPNYGKTPESYCNYRRYLSRLDLSMEDVIIRDSINFLYLIKNKNFTLNFENHTIKKMISLSKKTSNAKIIIKKILKYLN